MVRLSRIGAAAAARETVQGVEDAAPQRHQRDQQQIGKRDARQRHRQRKLVRLARKARRQELDHLRGEQQRQRQQHDLRREQQREDAVAELVRRPLAFLGADPRIGRNKSGIERALGEDGTEMIRQPEGDEKRVGRRPGAKDGGEHDVAHEAGQTRQQRVAADGENLLEHCRLGTTIRSSPRKRGPSRLEISVWIPACAGMSGASPSPPAPGAPHR